MRVLIGVLLSSLVLVGCGGGGSNPPPPAGAIQIVNYTSSNYIDETYVKLSASQTWSPEILNGASIPPTSSITTGALTPGSWDVMAVSNDSYSTYYAYASGDVLAGQTLQLSFFDGDFTGSLEVTNGYYSYSIRALYVTPSWSGTWGPNRLGSAPPVVYSGNFQVLDLDPDTYDVQCEYADHSLTYRNIPIDSLWMTRITCD